MPTGYTAPVQNGSITEFKDFAKNCARAFGALIHMRDMPSDAEVTFDSDENTYYQEYLDVAKDNLYNLYNSTDEEISERLEKEYDADEKYRLQSLEVTRIERNRYEDMLSQVINWEPPSKDHTELRIFMINQLKSSISSDCNEKWFNTPTKKLTISEWFDREEEEFKWDINYYSKNAVDNQINITSNKEWWDALVASL